MTQPEETREKKRERLWREYAPAFADNVPEALLAATEAAAEEARASERERVFKAIRASLIDDATTAQQMSWNEGIYHAAALASWTGKPAPPSPEPEPEALTERVATLTAAFAEMHGRWVALKARHDELERRVEALEQERRQGDRP